MNGHNITIDYNYSGVKMEYNPGFSIGRGVVVIDFAIMDNGVIVGYCGKDVDGYEVRGLAAAFKYCGTTR